MNAQAHEISTAELANDLRDPTTRLVDLRSVEAFNGWPLAGEPRGGHIAGAISFPFSWTKYRLEVHELLRQKDVTPGRKVLLYGYDPAEMQSMVDLLKNAGHNGVRRYGGFAEAWSADETLPMSRRGRASERSSGSSWGKPPFCRLGRPRPCSRLRPSAVWDSG
jgi:thiosulfate/3-mercaptopyruvate sulfurtransferase